MVWQFIVTVDRTPQHAESIMGNRETWLAAWAAVTAKVLKLTTKGQKWSGITVRVYRRE